jgi:hypothetical protein
LVQAPVTTARIVTVVVATGLFIEALPDAGDYGTVARAMPLATIQGKDDQAFVEVLRNQVASAASVIEPAATPIILRTTSASSAS